MAYKTDSVAPPQIEQAILLIRGQRVMLDRDLAAMYGVSTGNLTKAVRRNLSRFLGDFMFQLTADEAKASRFQIGILKKGMNIKYLPYVFMQEGVAMLSGVLRSPRAEQVNIAICARLCGCGKRCRSTRNSRTNWANWNAKSKTTTKTSARCSRRSIN
ncbi:MAG TPA: ORF6N domain-containing protein [Candidatus Paceibacterota bacterium]|nr:ORF6N domain-containing protein [Candidatus Paceibacterota bacterium]